MSYRELLSAIFGIKTDAISDPSGKDIEDVLKTLPESEAFVIRARFGIPMLRKEVARQFIKADGTVGATTERIRQIEARALRKLRHPSRSRVLRRYIAEEA